MINMADKDDDNEDEDENGDDENRTDLCVFFFLGGGCVRVIHWHKGYPKGSAGMRFVQRLATPAFAPNSCLRETLPRALALGPSSFLRGKR